MYFYGKLLAIFIDNRVVLEDKNVPESPDRRNPIRTDLTNISDLSWFMWGVKQVEQAGAGRLAIELQTYPSLACLRM